MLLYDCAHLSCLLNCSFGRRLWLTRNAVSPSHGNLCAQCRFFLSLTQAAYRLCCYHRLVRAPHPMYRFWYIWHCTFMIILKVLPKLQVPVSISWGNVAGADRQTDGRTDLLFIIQIPSCYLSSSSISTNDVSKLSSVLNDRRFGIWWNPSLHN